MEVGLKVGESVQALDELGRWENGRISSTDGDTVTVNFPGWGDEFNITCNRSQVRRPVDGRLTVSGASNKRRIVPRALLDLLKKLCRGDKIKVVGVEEMAEVQEVDQFYQAVTVLTGEDLKIVDVVDLRIDRPCFPLPSKHTKRKKKMTVKPPMTGETLASDINSDVPVVQDESDPEGNVDGFVVLHNSRERLECGAQVSVGALPATPLIVTALSIKDGTFFGDAVLLRDPQIKIRAPLDKLEVSKEPNTRDSKKLGKALFEQAFQNSLENSKNSYIFRKVQRKNQLAFLLKTEIQQLLRGNNNRKILVLGLFVPEVDVDIFGIYPPNKKNVSFSYRSKNVESLDTLLGPRWDIFLKESHLRFITRVMFKLGKGDMLSCVALAASSATMALDNYRELLAQEVNKV